MSWSRIVWHPLVPKSVLVKTAEIVTFKEYLLAWSTACTRADVGLRSWRLCAVWARAVCASVTVGGGLWTCGFGAMVWVGSCAAVGSGLILRDILLNILVEAGLPGTLQSISFWTSRNIRLYSDMSLLEQCSRGMMSNVFARVPAPNFLNWIVSEIWVNRKLLIKNNWDLSICCRSGWLLRVKLWQAAEARTHYHENSPPYDVFQLNPPETSWILASERRASVGTLEPDRPGCCRKSDLMPFRWEL